MNKFHKNRRNNLSHSVIVDTVLHKSVWTIYHFICFFVKIKSGIIFFENSHHILYRFRFSSIYVQIMDLKLRKGTYNEYKQAKISFINFEYYIDMHY